MRGLPLIAVTVVSTLFASSASALTVSIPSSLYGHFNQIGSGICEDASGKNYACGPAATANSFLMLDNKYGTHLIGDRDLDEDVDDFDVGIVAAELANLMGCAPCNGGTTVSDLISGKQQYLASHATPDIDIVVHSQARPSFDWFFDELTGGQDIEVLLTFYDVNGDPIGGHYITLNGISGTDANGDGVLDAGASADFIDPAGGVDRSRGIYEFANSHILGSSYGVGGTIGGKVVVTTVVEYGIAESVPEAGTLMLILAGSPALLWCRRRMQVERRDAARA